MILPVAEEGCIAMGDYKCQPGWQGVLGLLVLHGVQVVPKSSTWFTAHNGFI